MALVRGSCVLAALITFAVGCGGETSTEETAGRDAPPASDFPPAEGRTLEQIAAEGAATEQVVVSPAGAVYERGKNRFAFGVFTAGREQITDADVAIYAAPGANGKAKGPFPARIDSLETDPAFEAKTTADDPDSALAIYLSELSFDRDGEWRLLALVRQRDELLASRLPSVVVEEHPEIPAVGEKVPSVHTPTAAEVTDLGEIDTRVPHDSMHEDDLADVLGKKPVVLLFATPALCQSRVCGPVVDVAEQVKSETDEDVSFIHMEVYNDNDPNKGLRPQLEAYGLPTEPWLFVIDREGRVATRIEGGFGVEEVQRAVDGVAE